MDFDSKKGMNDVYNRLVHFRNFIKFYTSYQPEYLEVLDELICRLHEHDSKVFKRDFLSSDISVEEILIDSDEDWRY